MILSEQYITAMELIADMPPGDPGNSVKNELHILKEQAPESEADMFDELWEAYMANL